MMNRTWNETERTPNVVVRQRRRWRRTACECAGGAILMLCATGWWGGASLATQAAEDPTSPASPASVTPTSAPARDTSGGAAGGTGSSSSIVVEAEDSGTRSNEPRVLSTEPLIARPRVTIDRSKRPSWVETPPVRVGELHTTTVSSGPFATQRGALDRLDDELQAAVRSYVDEHLDTTLAGEKIRYTVKEIKTRLVKEPVYLEYGEFEGLGTMQDAHAQLVFDASFRAELEEKWQQIRTLGRLWNFACVAGAALATVGVLRMAVCRRGKSADQARGSLKFVASTAILTLVLAGIVLAARFMAF